MEKQILITELRALEGSKQVKARVNDYTLSKELKGRNGKFREIISKDVWTRALEKANNNIKVFINHSPYVDIMDSVELRAEDDGVYLYGTLLDKAENVYKAIQEGKINGVSFGFRALKDSFKKATGYLERHIEEMELFEVSLLDVEAAYMNTYVEARALELPIDKTSIRQRQLDLLKMI